MICYIYFIEPTKEHCMIMVLARYHVTYAYHFI